MKKLFTKSLIAVGVAGLMGLTSVAMAAEANWYGSIRAGVTSNDTDGEGGATVTSGANTLSRIGINASTDLGNGQSAGANVELGINTVAVDDDDHDGDDVTTRRRNVWIQGGWGKLTLGKQNGIYRSAANWDQSWFLGGNVRFGGDVDSATGISYASNLAGPFSFEVEVVSAADTNEEDGKNNSKAIGNWATTAHYDFGVATVNLGVHRHSVDSGDFDSAISGLVGASVKLSNATVTTDITAAVAERVKAVKAVADEVAGANFDNSVISVNGSSAGFDWYLAYERSKLQSSTKADLKGSTIGVFLSYDVSNSDKVYLEYERGKVDFEDKFPNDKSQATLVGYSHNIGEGVDFIAEYVTAKGFDDIKANKWNLSLKYDF